MFFRFFRLEASNLAHVGILVPQPAASCPRTGDPDTVLACIGLDFELKKRQKPLGIF